ncbi:GTP-binding protein, putative [Hepatocystis sp. ex Piliocolobus tephrosceles]|nr:GTP-binding protein, putative [Hepatocystis sp. ex Piliocolobus tephrosceles]
MFRFLTTKVIGTCRYRVIRNSHAFNYKRVHFNSTVNNNINVEQDYFYVNPLRKLSCIGCGEFLQTTAVNKTGYVPNNIYEKYTNGRLKFYTKVKGEEVNSIPDGVKVDVNNFINYRIKTRIILCKRCYRLQHYKCNDMNYDVDVNRIQNIIKCRKQIQNEIKMKVEKVKKKNENLTQENVSEDKQTNYSTKKEFKDIFSISNVSRIVKNNQSKKKHENGSKYMTFIERKINKACTKKKKKKKKKVNTVNAVNAVNIIENGKSRIDCSSDVILKNYNVLVTVREDMKKTANGDGLSRKKVETNTISSENNESNERYYQDDNYNIDKRSVNVYEKKDVLKKRNNIKRLDVEKMLISTGKYVEGDRNNIMNNLIKKMKRKSLVLYLIDITNIENTILPELYIGCKNKDINIIWLVNKIDCLPKSTDIAIIKIWFRNMVRQIKNCHINDLLFISALKCYNYDMLEERMKYYIDLEKGTDIYIVGCVNVGKSSFINAFLRFINYRHIGNIYNKRKKGGVTTSNLPYTTLNYNVFKLKKNINLIDTIGIPTKYQYSSILYKNIDLNSICINKKIQPFTYKLKTDSSILLGSLCYINFIYGNFAFLTFYISNKVTIHLCKTEKVESLLQKKKCFFLYPPHTNNDFDLLMPFVKHTVQVYGKDFESVDDIVIADLGWFSVTGTGIKIFEIYAPKNIKIYRRPSMINDSIKHTHVDVFKYKSYRGRTNKILKKKKKLIEQLDRLNPQKREEIKTLTIQKERVQIEKLSNFNDVGDATIASTTSGSTSILSNRVDLENIIHSL